MPSASASRRTSSAPSVTWSPTAQSTSATVASNGAASACSIFIASSVTSGWPLRDLVAGRARDQHDAAGHRRTHLAVAALLGVGAGRARPRDRDRPRRPRTAPPGRRAPAQARLEAGLDARLERVVVRLHQRRRRRRAEAEAGQRAGGPRRAVLGRGAARSPPRSAGTPTGAGLAVSASRRASMKPVSTSPATKSGSLSSRARKPALVFTGQTSTAPQATASCEAAASRVSARGRSAWRSSDRRRG